MYTSKKLWEYYRWSSEISFINSNIRSKGEFITSFANQRSTKSQFVPMQTFHPYAKLTPNSIQNPSSKTTKHWLKPWPPLKPPTSTPRKCKPKRTYSTVRRWKEVLWKECGDSLFFRFSAIVKINARIGRTCDMYKQNNVTSRDAEQQRTRFPLPLCQSAKLHPSVSVLTYSQTEIFQTNPKAI